MKKIGLNWLRNNRLHILVWSLFIAYETTVVGLISGVFGNPLTYIVHYLLIILLFYLNANVGLVWALTNRKDAFWRVPFLLTIEIAGYLLFTYLADSLLFFLYTTAPNLRDELSYQRILKTLFRCVYFLGISSGYYLLISFLKQRRQTEELERERLKGIIYQKEMEQELSAAQNAFLKAQITPHLLFNTLDFVYQNVMVISPPAAEAIVTLADMMRYAINAHHDSDFITLSDEMEQVENLIQLFRLKQGVLNLQVYFPDEVKNVRLIPLVLLTLVENIFKHGDVSLADQPALLMVYLKDGELHIETENLTHPHKRKSGSHAGLLNIEKRLKIAYGEQTQFAYHADSRNYFVILIRIPLENTWINSKDKVIITDGGN